MNNLLKIRLAGSVDADQVLVFSRELAEYERLARDVLATDG